MTWERIEPPTPRSTCAICRHMPGDPNCSKSQGYRYDPATTPPAVPATPDASNFEVVDVREVGAHMVMKVKYPNCAKCAYEGVKVMVFLECKALDAIKWRTIDPHFRGREQGAIRYRNPKEAPSPAARFPGDDQGWTEALEYASRRGQR